MRDESSPERPDLLPSLLGPAAGALERLPPEIRAPIVLALKTSTPALRLLEAEALAIELAAESARQASPRGGPPADRMVAALRELERREERRWTRVAADVDRLLSGGEAPDATELARLLAVDGPAADAGAFDAFMRDDGLTLRLSGEAIHTDVDHAERLEAIAQAVQPRAALSARDLERLARPDRLGNGDRCGAFTGSSTVILSAGRAAEFDEPLRQIADPGDMAYTPRVARLASDAAPVLRPSARAGYVACLLARDVVVPVGAERFAGWLSTGVPLEAEDSSAYEDLAKRLRAVWKAAHGGRDAPLAAALLAVTYEIQRLRFALEPLSRSPQQELGAIDVGRVRWCELSARPIVWLPLFAQARDQVGGGDRPWTADLPAAGATWQASSPALRLDPEWSAAIVMVADSSHLYCVDPTGGWWSLDADFDAILYARTDHLQRWRDAQSAFEEELPQIIDGFEAADPAAEPFSREWVERHAGRYEYDTDSAAQHAGARAHRARRYTRDDFLTVVAWKAPRALPRAQLNDAESVEAATRAAFAADDELTRIAHLTSLNGVGVPIASALLHFAFPDQYPILDYRALATLGDDRRRTQYSARFWVDFVERCRALAAAAGVSMRDLDKALWQASRDADRKLSD